MSKNTFKNTCDLLLIGESDKRLYVLLKDVNTLYDCGRKHFCCYCLQEDQTPALFQYSPNCALKFFNQFRCNILKNQFKKRNNPSKRGTNSILLNFFNATLTSAGQKNAELIFEKLHLIHKLKFRIFNSMAVISYLSFHM